MLTIHNNYTSVANTVSLNEETVLDVLDTFDITFEVENTLDLNSLISDFGVSLSDFDPSLFHAE